MELTLGHKVGRELTFIKRWHVPGTSKSYLIGRPTLLSYFHFTIELLL